MKIVIPNEDELLAQAKELRNFLQIMFPKETHIYIQPILSDGIQLDYQLGVRELLDTPIVNNKPIKVESLINLKAGESGFIRSPAKTQNVIKRNINGLNIKQLLTLWQYAALGYNVFYSINPISCSIKSKHTVKYISHILIESDTDSIETQQAFADSHIDIIKASYTSGNKSIHTIVALDEVLFNKYLGYKQYAELNRLKRLPSIQNKTYDIIVQYIRSVFTDINADPKTLNNYACYSRLPTFPHPHTGKIATINIINPDASLFISKCISTIKLNMHISMQNNDLHASIPPTIANTDIEKHKEYSINNVTNVGRTSLFEYWIDYKRINTYGLPEVGTRLKASIAFHKVGQMLGRDMSQEWRAVLERGNIRCSIEDGMKSYLQLEPTRIFIPDMSAIDINKATVGAMQWDVFVDYKDVRKENLYGVCRHILEKVIEMPLQAERGQLGLYSINIKNACVDQKYKSVMRWLEANNICKMKTDYAAKKQTRKYWVNIPLLLVFMGYADMQIIK